VVSAAALATVIELDALPSIRFDELPTDAMIPRTLEVI
jgi:hypothetical protein